MIDRPSSYGLRKRQWRKLNGKMIMNMNHPLSQRNYLGNGYRHPLKERFTNACVKFNLGTYC